MRLEHLTAQCISPDRRPAHFSGGKAMEWTQAAGSWKQAKIKIQRKWGKLSDDDLDLIDGRRDRLERKILQLYGFAPDHVRKEVDDWVRWQGLAGPCNRKAQLRSELALG
jgi:uncharacterized protein YjbJ (UPF0337 family)